MKKTIYAASGHTLYVASISREALPAHLRETNEYTTFYEVRNWDETGVTFMYLGKGYRGQNASPKAQKEIVVWYRNGGFWSGCGNTLKTAIDGAQRDGWMYA